VIKKILAFLLVISQQSKNIFRLSIYRAPCGHRFGLLFDSLTYTRVFIITIKLSFRWILCRVCFLSFGPEIFSVLPRAVLSSFIGHRLPTDKLIYSFNFTSAFPWEGCGRSNTRRDRNTSRFSAIFDYSAVSTLRWGQTRSEN